MTFEIWAALAVVCITVYGLLKRWETRLVLLTSGFAMCLLALDPMPHSSLWSVRRWVSPE